MMALAVMAWALRRGWIRHGHFPLARILSSSPPKRIAEFAIGELVADKVPFKRSRLNAAPLASRIASAVICGAAICGGGWRPLVSGAALGASGALVGCVAGHYMREKLNRDLPDFAVGLLEDAVALGGGAIVVALGVRA
jgi:uncharacterized membrane protein